MIRPGYLAHVMTIGDNPATPFDDQDENKRIAVDRVEAWTSYEHDTVTGIVTPNATLVPDWASAVTGVVVTVAGSLSLGSGYITPGSSVTYAERTLGAGGTFSAATFRTSADATYKTVAMAQGTTGFIRVVHATGDEVYGVHGQNALVLENSQVVHGYAFPLPGAPGGLVSGVTVSRPSTSVTVTLKDSLGGLKGSVTKNGATPYNVSMGADIIGGGSSDGIDQRRS